MIFISCREFARQTLLLFSFLIVSCVSFGQQSKVYKICDDKGCRTSDGTAQRQSETEINASNEIVWRGEDVATLLAELQTGNPHSAHKLGQLSQFGLGGVAKDVSKAIGYYQRSADLGYGWASFRLAELIGRNESSSVRSARFTTLMLDAANKHVPQAMHNAGTMYQSGSGVPKHMREAVRWFEAAASSGVPESRLALALLYLNGWEGERPRIHDGFILLTRAAESGHVEAKFSLARIYQTGFREIPQNMDKAADWLRQAARDGHVQAKSELKDLEVRIKERNEYRQKMQEKQMEFMGSLLNTAVTAMLSPPTISISGLR